MNELSIDDWKVFLKARIEQEQGNDESALRVFDRLLEKYPGNAHLATSRVFALDRLGRGAEAAVATIAAKYATLGRKLVGEQDKPGLWATELHALLDSAGEFEKSGHLSATLVAW